MRLGILTPSVSYKAGGLYYGVRRAAQVLQENFIPEIQIFGLEDERTHKDLVAWGALPVQIFRVWGPHVFGYAPALSKALEVSHLDMIHVRGIWMYPSIACLQWARRTKKPYVISTHGMLDPWAVSNFRWKKLFAGFMYENVHLQNAACLVALCEAEAQAMRGYGLRNPIAIIPNGVDLPSENLLIKNSNKQKKTFLYIGRLHPKKNLPNLLRAWQVLLSDDIQIAKDWQLNIAGWDQMGHEEELKSLCQQLNIESSAHFLGPRFGNEKEAMYLAADAVILPSFSEGLPIAVLEAWAYALPVLMTAECHLPDGFREGTAIQIQTNMKSIAEGMRNFISMSDEERHAIGQRGRKLAEKFFSWSTITAELYAVYRWVLGKGEKPACVTIS